MSKHFSTYIHNALIISENIVKWLNDKLDELNARTLPGRRRGITDAQVAKAVGRPDGRPYSRTTISKYRKGNGIKEEWIRRFAAFYGFDLPAELSPQKVTNEIASELKHSIDRMEATINAQTASLARMEQIIEAMQRDIAAIRSRDGALDRAS